MFYEYEKDIGYIEVVGINTEEMPMWTINHYFKVLCDNYVKLILLEKLCTLAQQGLHSSNIAISRGSVPIMPKGKNIERFLYNNENIVEYVVKNEQPDKFWELFKRCERPMIYRRELDNSWTPLYDYFSDEAIKICRVAYNSPIETGIKGITSALIDLTTSNRRNRWEEEEHITRQIDNLANSYGSIVRATQIIEDERTPEGIKQYAREGLNYLMEKQRVMNERLDIRIRRIDRYV